MYIKHKHRKNGADALLSNQRFWKHTLLRIFIVLAS